MVTPTFMIIPSLACQASCKYCFGPHEGAIMDETVAEETIAFIHRIAKETTATKISIVFHGGEPLLAPFSVWEKLLSEIKVQISDYTVKLNIQSNLWNLTDDFIQLFRKHGVMISTSLDGPKALCDTNRGEGYFDRTFSAVQKAKAAGLPVSAIATITKQTLPHVQDVAKFFRNNGCALVLHGAQAGINCNNSQYVLSTDEYAGMIKNLFPWYIKNRKYLQIDTLDNFVRGITNGNPRVCTLMDCSDMFLAISPNGDITSCQRFAGKSEYTMGNIFDKPTLAKLYDSPAAKLQRNWELEISECCGECDVYEICKGGCYYNTRTSSDNVTDPLCEAYKEIYAFVKEKISEEMLSDENFAMVSTQPAEPGEHPLLRKGKYISLAKDIHPAHIADNARRLLAIYELGKTNNPQAAAQNLFDQRICGDVDITKGMISHMRDVLYKERETKNNCYIHITSNCNLRCSHCYADAGTSLIEMEATAFELIAKQAIDAKFRQIIITGGEPLVHAQQKEILKICAELKGCGTNLVLRTNLTGELTEDEFMRFGQAFDQVVVSVDGSEETHNARRGTGTYQIMTQNLAKYKEINGNMPHTAGLSLACVMNATDINGEAGRNVRALGESLGVKRIRFRPLLPLGRATNMDEPVICEGLMQHISPEDTLKSPFHPLTTCGLGQNIFIKPNGDAHPCYAWCDKYTCLGNVLDAGLFNVLNSSLFKQLISCSVDTIEKCKYCEYRYLCGGACRAWGNQSTKEINAAPVQCDHLKARAKLLIEAAKNYIVA